MALEDLLKIVIMNETTEIPLDILAIKTSEVVDIKENIKHIRSLKNINILTSIGVTWRDNNTLSSLLSEGKTSNSSENKTIHQKK